MDPTILGHVYETLLSMNLCCNCTDDYHSKAHYTTALLTNSTC